MTVLAGHRGVWKSKSWVKNNTLIDSEEGLRRPKRVELYEGMEVIFGDQVYELFMYDHVKDNVFLVKAEDL